MYANSKSSGMEFENVHYYGNPNLSDWFWQIMNQCSQFFWLLTCLCPVSICVTNLPSPFVFTNVLTHTCTMAEHSQLLQVLLHTVTYGCPCFMRSPHKAMQGVPKKMKRRERHFPDCCIQQMLYKHCPFSNSVRVGYYYMYIIVSLMSTLINIT